MIRTAKISDCGTYRYALGRRWSTEPIDLWVMLNPSTADAMIDDPTINRCISFSQGWGAGGIRVVNLFALRATNPAALIGHPDPVGPANDATLRLAAQDSPGRVICAWGAHPAAVRRAQVVRRILGPSACLGTTKAGAPRHPLYVRGDTPLVTWAP